MLLRHARVTAARDPQSFEVDELVAGTMTGLTGAQGMSDLATLDFYLANAFANPNTTDANVIQFAYVVPGENSSVPDTGVLLASVHHCAADCRVAGAGRL